MTNYEEQRAQERATAARIRNELAPAIMAALTRLTGDAWNTPPPEPENEIDQTRASFDAIRAHDGLSIYFYHDTYARRLSVHASEIHGLKDSQLHKHRTREETSEITVSPDREPGAIARDVIRRLLPDAEKAAARCREAIKEQAERDEWNDATTEAIKYAAPGFDFQDLPRAGTPYARHMYARNGHRADLETNAYNKTVTMKLEVSAPAALELLKVAAAWMIAP
jgi:hypothetical protein